MQRNPVREAKRMSEVNDKKVSNDETKTATAKKTGLERKCRFWDRLTLIVFAIQVLATAIMMKFLPDSIIMHYDSDGLADRYGSKSELYGLLLITGFVLMMFKAIEKQSRENASAAADEPKKSSAFSSLYALTIGGFATVTLLAGATLSLAIEALRHPVGTAETEFLDIFVMCSNLMIGLIIALLGNVMPKSRKNDVFGVRTSWSMYNDDTWIRTNRACGKICVITGVLSMIFSLFVNYKAASVIVLSLVMLMTIASIVISYRIYKDVCGKEEQGSSD